MLHQESEPNGSCETWEVSTEGKCISECFSRSPAGLLRLLVTRWSNSLALEKSLYFFVIVIALTKAGTSEIVAADQMREMQMVRAQSPAQVRTSKVYPPWVWQHPPPQGTGVWRPVKHMLCLFLGKKVTQNERALLKEVSKRKLFLLLQPSRTSCCISVCVSVILEETQ